MRRYVAPAVALLVIVVLAFVLSLRSQNSVPPEPPLDPLAIELRRFRSLTDESEQIEAIQRFNKVRDPRVVVALMEVVQAELAKGRNMSAETPALLVLASGALVHYHIPESEWLTAKYWTVASLWWEKHESEVRSQAAALPQ